MKKFNQFSKKKKKQLQISLSSIKTKIAVKFLKKLFFFFFSTEIRLGDERVKIIVCFTTWNQLYAMFGCAQAKVGTTLR